MFLDISPDAITQNMGTEEIAHRIVVAAKSVVSFENRIFDRNSAHLLTTRECCMPQAECPKSFGVDVIGPISSNIIRCDKQLTSPCIPLMQVQQTVNTTKDDCAHQTLQEHEVSRVAAIVLPCLIQAHAVQPARVARNNKPRPTQSDSHSTHNSPTEEPMYTAPRVLLRGGKL